MNPILEDIYRTYTTTTPDGGEVSLEYYSIDRDEAELLAQIVADIKPAVTLEVGLAFGVSALAICDAASKSTSYRHIVIDPYQNQQPWIGIGLHNLRKAGFGKQIEFCETYSYAALPELLATGQTIDFAFVDGAHTFDFVFTDFFYIDKMLNQGGVIAFDDADYPSIRRAIRYIVTNLPYKVYRTLPPHLIQKTFLRVARVQ